MPSSFGGNIKLSGETEYRKALKAINSDLKLLSSEMKTVTSAYDKNDKSVEKLNKENEVLNKQISEQQKKVDKLTEAVKESAKETGENSEATRKWQIQLNNAQADLNKLNLKLEHNQKALKASEEEFKDAAKDVDKFGDEIKQSADESDNAQHKFEKLGDVGKVAMGAIATASAATLAGIVAVTKGLTDATVGAAAHADEVLTQSQVTGIATDELQGYMYAAELVDVATDTLTGSMARNIRSMRSAAQGSAEYAEIYEQLGVSVTNADGSLRDSQETFWDLIDALGKVDNETERDSMAMKLLGRSAQDLNPLIKAGSQRMKELSAEAKNVGYTMSGDQLKAFSEFDDNVKKLETGAEAAKNALGLILLPILTDLSEDGVDLLGKFTTSVIEADGDIDKISSDIETLIPEALDKFNEKLPTIIDLAGSVLKGLGKSIFDNLPEVASSITTWLEDITDEMLTEDNIDYITDTGVDLFANLVSDASRIVSKIVEKCPDIIDGLFNALTEGDENDGTSPIGKMTEAGVKLITALVKAMPGVITELVLGVADIPGALFDALTSDENKSESESAGKSLAVELVKGLWEGIRDLVPNIMVGLLTKGEVRSWQDYVSEVGSGSNAFEFLEKIKEGDEEYFQQHPSAQRFRQQLSEYQKSHKGASVVSFLSEYGYDDIFDAYDKMGGYYADLAEKYHKTYESISVDTYQIMEDQNALADNTKEAMGHVSGVISDTADELTNKDDPHGVFAKFKQIGIDMLEGIQAGVRDAQTLLATKENVGFSIVDVTRAAMDAAEVNSPSKLWARELGEPMMEGLVYGVDKEADHAMAAIQDTISNITPEIDPDISVSNTKVTKPVAVSVSFGDVTINDGSDVDAIADKVIVSITDAVSKKVD